MKKLLILALWLTFVGTVAAQPPGNDGNVCHGANQEPCRPDPQPSHGRDCGPHGNNPDGNDDHCSAAPSVTPSEAPSPTGSIDVPLTDRTPPPTDTK